MLALTSDMECVLTGLCRVCATDEQPLEQIFNTQGVKQKLQIKIEKCLRIMVHESDALPTTVCGPCVARLDVSYELVQRCMRGQEELQQRLAAATGSTKRETQARSPGIRELTCIKHDEAASDSDSSEPTLQRLLPLDPHTLSASPPSPGHCRHSSGRSGECVFCGSLGVLADAVERIQDAEVPSTSKVTPSLVANSSTASSSSSSSLPVVGRRRQLSCEFCRKEFHHTGDLNKHRRSHTGERPYTCLECGKKFAHVSNLLRHRKLHSGERPFSCMACQRSFSRRDKLLSHNCAARAHQQ